MDSIPAFRTDGYLPEGIHRCSDAEATFRFGSANRRRQHLAIRMRRWIALCRDVGCRRLIIDGSFVTAKAQPHDVDAVCLLPEDFHQQLQIGSQSALELEQMLLNREPAEVFAAEDVRDLQDWLEFFSRTREPDLRRKGLIEIEL